MFKLASLNSIKHFKVAKSILPVRFNFSSKPFAPFTIQEDVDKLSTNYHISKNVGLNRFLQRAYNTTGLSILGALGTSMAVLSLPITTAGLSAVSIGGFVASLVGLVGTIMMKPKV